MIRVSVIIAAYDAIADIERAVGSVLAQSEASLEVIVVDDCSRDATFDWAQALAARDPRVRALRVAQNGGPGFARNVGLDAARGEWVAVLDSDDAFRPERLTRLLALAEGGGADVISDNLALRDPQSGAITGLMFPPEWFASDPQTLQAAAFVVGNMGDRTKARLAYGFVKPLIRRSFLERHGLRYRVSRFAEDYIFYLDLFARGARWLMTSQAFYDYDVRSASLTIGAGEQDKQTLMIAERELLTLSSVRADPELQSAIHRHIQSIEMSVAWTRVAEALKARDLKTALSSASGDLATAAHVAREIGVHLRRALAQALFKKPVREIGRLGDASAE